MPFLSYHKATETLLRVQEKEIFEQSPGLLPLETFFLSP